METSDLKIGGRIVDNCHKDFDCCKELIQEIRCLKESVKRCCHVMANNQQVCNCNCEQSQSQEQNCGGGQGSGLCITNSVCDTGTEGTATVTVPGNSCITKIYASFIKNPGGGSDPKYLFVSFDSGESSFCHFIGEGPQPNSGSLDTTLVQPLCVGPENVMVTAQAQAQGGVNTTAANVALTVVYCPFCECTSPPPPAPPAP